MRIEVALLVLLLTASLFAVNAQAATPAEKQQARERVASGKRHYNLSEFADALKDYKEAYRLTDDPNLLFNIGQCEWKLGDDKNALHSYRAYLRNGSDPVNRTQVEARIAELEKKVKAAEQASSDRAAAEKAAQQAAADRAAAEKAAQEAATARSAAERLNAATAAADRAAQDKAASEKAATAAEKTATAAQKTADAALAQPKTVATAAPAPVMVVANSPPPPSPALDVTRPGHAEEAHPFYTRWWFWTAAGAVVAGLAITAIVLGGSTEAATRGDLGSGLVVIP